MRTNMSNKHVRKSRLLLGIVVLCAVAVSAYAAVGGKAQGSWDLPLAGAGGQAQGVLFDGAGSPHLFIDATLTEVSSPNKLLIVGEIDGVLQLPGHPTAYPRYTVRGSYQGFFSTKSGTFHANIFSQQVPGGPEVIVGKIGGEFADNTMGVGQFQGDWGIDP